MHFIATIRQYLHLRLLLMHSLVRSCNVSDGRQPVVDSSKRRENKAASTLRHDLRNVRSAVRLPRHYFQMWHGVGGSTGRLLDADQVYLMLYL